MTKLFLALIVLAGVPNISFAENCGDHKDAATCAKHDKTCKWLDRNECVAKDKN